MNGTNDKRVRWGILGTGYIAGLFAEGVRAVGTAELAAVGSRRQETAERFGTTWSIPRRHASYLALATDPQVDVVYIATPHPYHFECAKLCLEHGKHVLVEKPLALNARQGAELIEIARAHKRFLMEAMWTRFLPAMVRVREVLASGEIGEVRLVRASLSLMKEFDPQHRLFNPELGGGSLLDVGVYPISFASMVLGEPESVAGVAQLGPTGTDDESAYLLQYPGGRTALLSSAVRLPMPIEAQIFGTQGYITVHQSWINPRSITVGTRVKPGVLSRVIFEGNLYDTRTEYLPTTGNGYNYEVQAVQDAILSGQLEHPAMPLAESLSIARTMDELRGRWGLRYPME